MRDSIRLGRVAGFPVALHWSVLFILWLFTWSLASFSLPRAAPGYPTALYWAGGLAGALLLLGSLLAHELAHAVVAERAGVEVRSLTLWLLGGLATLGGEAKSPGAEFRIAAVGPATSLLLAVAFGISAIGLNDLGVPYLVVTVGWWLAITNVVLAVFNLIPGAPLDGGRILRSYLWHRSGDPARAAVGATRAGQIVAFVLMALGLLEFVYQADLGGLWLVLIGLFIYGAARAEQADAVTRGLLAGIRVAEVMSPNPVTCPAQIPLDVFIQQYVLGFRHSAYPVTGPDGQIEGLVTLAQVRPLPHELRGSTRIRDVAIPLDQVVVAVPGDDLTALLPRLSAASGNRALVLDHGTLAGIVTPADITRAAEARSRGC